jgi:hypothetical protein
MLTAVALMLPRLVLAPLITVVLTYAPPRPIDRTALVPAPCRHTGGSNHNSYEQRDGGLIRWRAHWSGDNCSIDIRSNGEVRFNPDFTDIVWMSNGGTLEITETQGSTARRLSMRYDGSGRVVRAWAINGREQAWDGDAQRWLADLLVELDRMSGIGVNYRFASLHARGGAPAVIAEVEKMYSDYVRSIYLRRLIDSTNLTDAEYERIVAVAARDMSSDYEMSRVLRAVAEKSPLDNAGMRRSYIAAVGRMTSDYERSRVLQTIVAKAPTSHEVGAAAVRAAGSFSSDYERSRVLLAAIANKSLDVDDVLPILETVAKSTSDYEKARVLIAVAARWTILGENRKAYLRAADTIRSDYENRRVLSALVMQETR